MHDTTTPTDLSQAGTAMARARWARVADRAKATEPARDAFDARFYREADADGVVDPAERAYRAQQARRAYFTELSRRAAAARMSRRGGAASDATMPGAAA